MIIYTYRKIRAYRARKAPEADTVTTTGGTPSVTPATTAAINPSSTKKKCPHCAQEKSAVRKYRWKLLFCLLPAFFVASLDLTIVASALPEIASHFNRFNQLNWIVTAFTLTNTAFIPVFGQLADIFGRHSTLQFSVALLTIGSVLCAAAPDWAVLLLGRALQGAATAGVANVCMIILADSVSLKEQAVNTSIFQLMNGVGYSVGPVIGGYLTNSNWRYCFALCAGVSALSVLTIFLLRKDLKPGKVSLSRPSNNQTSFQALTSGLSTLDFGGIVLFILGVGLVILGTAWGGSTYPWSSAAVISTLVIGSVLICLFVLYESLFAPSQLLNRLLPRTVPMIPSSILSSKDVSLICFIAAGTGAALYSVFYFIGIYFTLVEAYKASHAGTQLLYYIPGLGAGVYLAILVCNVYPRQTFYPLFIGTVVENTGIAALAYAVKARDETLVNVMMAIAGAGTGMRFMPSNLHLAGMFRDRLAPVYSLLRFAMPFGGTLALTVMGSVFQNQMSAYFGSSSVISASGTSNSTSPSNGTSFNLHNQASLDLISTLPPAQQEAIRSQGATATMWAFISIIPILGLSLLASLFLGNVWISKKSSSSGTKANGEAEKGEIREDGICARHAARVEILATGSRRATPGEEKNEVEFLSGVFLVALFKGNVAQLKRPGVSQDGVPASISGEGAHLHNKSSEDEVDTGQTASTTVVEK